MKKIYGFDELRIGLQKAAKGNSGVQAAVGLLLDHDRSYWIRLIASHYPDVVHDHGDGLYGLDWPQVAHRASREWSSANSERQIVLIACSLADPKVQVSLHECIDGMGENNTRFVLYAVAVAAGHDYAGGLPRAGFSNT